MVNSNADDIFSKIESGELDMANSTIPPQVLRKYATGPEDPPPDARRMAVRLVVLPDEGRPQLALPTEADHD